MTFTKKKVNKKNHPEISSIIFLKKSLYYTKFLYYFQTFIYTTIVSIRMHICSMKNEYQLDGKRIIISKNHFDHIYQLFYPINWFLLKQFRPFL